jgi:hypothetical protein
MLKSMLIHLHYSAIVFFCRVDRAVIIIKFFFKSVHCKVPLYVCRLQLERSEHSVACDKLDPSQPHAVPVVVMFSLYREVLVTVIDSI